MKRLRLWGAYVAGGSLCGPATLSLCRWMECTRGIKGGGLCGWAQPVQPRPAEPARSPSAHGAALSRKLAKVVKTAGRRCGGAAAGGGYKSLLVDSWGRSRSSRSSGGPATGHSAAAGVTCARAALSATHLCARAVRSSLQRRRETQLLSTRTATKVVNAATLPPPLPCAASAPSSPKRRHANQAHVARTGKQGSQGQCTASLRGPRRLGPAVPAL